MKRVYFLILCLAVGILCGCTQQSGQEDKVATEMSYSERYRQDVYEPYLALMAQSDQYMNRATTALQGLQEEGNEKIIETLQSTQKDLKAQIKAAKALKAPSYLSKAQEEQFKAMIEAFVKATETQGDGFRDLEKAIKQASFGKETLDAYQRSANTAEQESAKAALAFVGLSKAYGIDYTAEHDSSPQQTQAS